MNNSKGFKMKSSYNSPLKQTGKMEAVGSMERRAQYDRLGWAYDETIPIQGPLRGTDESFRENRPTTRSSNAGLPVVNTPAKKSTVTKKPLMPKMGKKTEKKSTPAKTSSINAKPKTVPTLKKAVVKKSTPKKAVVKKSNPKKEIKSAKKAVLKEARATKRSGLKELRTEKKGARKNARSTKKVSRLEDKLEAAKKAKK